MFIYTIIAYTALAVTFISAILAVSYKHAFYWVTAISLYIFSFLAGFSIGQLTIGIVFIPLLLACGYTFKWITNKRNLATTIVSGAAIGLFVVIFVRGALFYPLTYFFS